jgi:drug/metabolite transporter (DMT)-like permease
MTPRSTAAAVFVGFALLIALRDILSEVFLNENPICLAWLVCTTIFLLSLSIILLKGGSLRLLAALGQPGVAWRVLCLNLLACVVYAVTFYMIRPEQLGAGLFNLVDTGLIPCLTAALGLWLAREKLLPELPVALLLYVLGVWLLIRNVTSASAVLVLIALASPVGTALSDFLSKRLLAIRQGEQRTGQGLLSRAELLCLRFCVPAVFLGVLAHFRSPTGLSIRDWDRALPVAVFCGFVPLWLLCTALRREDLTRLAVWELLIPALAFLGTLPWHPEHARAAPLLGASLILLGFVLDKTQPLTHLWAAWQAPPAGDQEPVR